MTRCVVWVAGNRAQIEFDSVLEWLEMRAQVRFVPVDELNRSVEPLAATSSQPPTLMLFLSPRPESVTRATVARWQRRFPLARFAVLLGSWCEGETRSGRPWPGVLRIYWHQAEPRLAPPLDRSTWEVGEWLLPRTATEAERLEAALLGATEESARGRRLAVWSAQTAGYEAVADGCRAVGWEPVRWSDLIAPLPTDIERIVLDLPSLPDFTSGAWQNSAWQARGIPAIALVGFPRWEDDVEFRRWGVAVLGKPWRLSDFRGLLARGAARSPSRPLDEIE